MKRTENVLPSGPAPGGREAFTDLALEQQTVLRRQMGSGGLRGLECRVRARRDIHTTRIRVTEPEAAEALGKPMGTYVTLQTDPDRLGRGRGKERMIQALAGELEELLDLEPEAGVLVVGLGNARVAYDALGPRTLEGIRATRHLLNRLPPELGPLRPVSTLAPGVLGRTGVESAHLIQALLDREQAGAVVVIDALAARDRAALGTAVQLTDTGLCPGSGILSGRQALDRDTLGVPVFALGVPMLSTLEGTGDFLVIPRLVEARTGWFAEVLSRALNRALQPRLSEAQLRELAGELS